MPKITTKTVGAGGSWKVIDEYPDPSVVKQLTPHSCVAAVGEMLLRSRGISVSQQEIIDIIGEPSSLQLLSSCLNEIDTNWDGESWHAVGVKRKNLSVLLRQGAFGVVLREGRTLGHVVVVREIDNRMLVIDDPWEGTSYKMSLFEFFRHWNGEVIFRWKF